MGNPADFSDWRGFGDRYIPHGYVGNFLTLWYMFMLSLNIGIIVFSFRLTFLSAIIPTLSEGGIVLLAALYMLYRHMQAQRKSPLENTKLTIMGSANFDNDIDLVGFNFIFLIPEVTMLIVYWTTVTVLPADGTIITFLGGEYLTVWDGTINLRYILAFFIVVKACVLLAYALRLEPARRMWKKLHASGVAGTARRAAEHVPLAEVSGAGGL
jgi:hypothetical protein